jgi:hypothetical protein
MEGQDYMSKVNVDEYIEKNKSSFYSKMLKDEKEELAKARAILREMKADETKRKYSAGDDTIIPN